MEKSKIHLTASQKSLVEKLAAAYEQTGMASVAARILALLLIADDHDLTFDQVQHTLGVSKSATSTSLSFLVNTGKVEQVTKIGQRKRFFRNRINHWKEDMKLKNEQTALFVALLRQVLRQRPGDTTEFNKNLADLIDFVEFIQQELPALFKKWEAKRG